MKILMKNSAIRRKNFPNLRGWSVSLKGNVYINKDGFNIVIYKKHTGTFDICITNRVTNQSQYGLNTYHSVHKAKLACFDALNWAKINLVSHPILS